MSTATRTWPLLGLLALWTGWAGCGSSADEASLAGPASGNVCTTDADCVEGAGCHEGMCVGSADDPLMLHLEVVPQQYPSGAAGPGTWLPPFRIDGPVDRVHSLPAPAPLNLSVRNLGEALPAEVRLVEVPAFEGLPARAQALRASQGELAIELPTGTTYALVATPDDDALPPLGITLVAGDDGTIDIDYSATALSTRRFLLQGSGAQRALDVQAFDADTGLVVSSRGQTDTGDVTLVFAPGSYAYVLEMRPTTAADAPREACTTDGQTAPTYRVMMAAADDTADAGLTTALGERPRRFPADAPPLEVMLPDTLPAITYRGTVTLCEEAGAPQENHAIPLNLDAVELLREPDLDPEPAFVPPSDGADMAAAVTATASFRTAATATYDGAAGQLQFCVTVLPGTYEVIASPPGSIECGLFAEQRLVKAPAGSTEKTGDSLALGSVATVTGQLTTATGGPLASAVLEARPTGVDMGLTQADGALEVTRYNRAQQATSDADGMFSLRLDMGAYDVTAKPQVGSGFGWLVVRDVRIANRVKDIPGNLRFDAPVPVSGTINYGDDAEDLQLSLAGARVRAFTRLRDAESGAARSVEVGEASVAEDGTFELLISPASRNGLLGDL